MGYSVQAGHFAVMTEGTPGTFPGTFATDAIAMKMKSAGGLAANRELLVPDAEIGGGRDIVDAYLGAVNWSGDYEFYARFNGLLTMLYAALGTKMIANPGGSGAVHTITISGTPTGGTFTITYSTQTTAAIPYNATAAQVQAALEALSNVDPGDVTVTGGPGPTTAFTLTWGGSKLGVTTAPTATASFTGGTTPAIAVTTTTPATTYTGAAVHTFLPSDSSQLPFLAVQERFAAGLDVYNYTDCVVNSLHLEAEANGYLQGTIGMIAKKQVAGAAAIDPTSLYDNLPMVVGTNIFVTYNGLTLPAKSFSFDLTNNFEDDDYRLGSFYIGDLTPKRREVTIGVNIRESDNALWRQATYGVSGATEAGGLSTKAPMKLTMQTYEAIPGATPGTLKYTLELNLPNCIVKPYAFEGSGDDIVDSDLEFQAVRPDPSRHLMRAAVTTNKTTVN